MAVASPGPANPDASTLEDARVAYQVAISLWVYQGEQAWARFNVMLVAHTIVIAVIGFALSTAQPPSVLTRLLPAAGLFLCGIWFISARREAAYSDYYIMAAREIEERYFAGRVRTVSRGGAFAEGDPVTIEISGTPRTMQMGRLARVFRAKSAPNLVIFVLVLLYVAFLVQAWW